LREIAYGTREARRVLTAAIVGSGVAFLDSTIVNVALPSIGRGLATDLRGLQWTVDAYMLALTAFLLPGGALGDRYGRRRVFVVGLLAFGAASGACALAPTAAALAVARAIQGVAGALLVPGSLALLRAAFRPQDQARAIGVWSALSGVSTALGPLAGGWLAEAVSWRAIFLENLPLVGVAAWAARGPIPEAPARAGRPDLAGAALVAAGLGAVTAALIEAPGRGATPTVVAGALAGVLALAAFIRVEARRADPMLPLGLFRSRAFTAANVVTLGVYLALGGAMFLTVLQLQAGLGWSPLAAGAALLPVTLLVLVLSPLAGRACARVGPWPLLGGGPALIALGVLLLGRVSPGASYERDVLPGVLALGVGLGLTVAPLTIAALGAAPADRAGIASGVNNAVARLAGLLAVAALPLVGGIAPDALRTGTFQAGYSRAMSAAAILAAAGGLSALLGPSRRVRFPAVRARRRLGARPR